MMPRSARNLLAAVPLFAIASAAAAGDSVDLELRGRDAVQGTIRPADEHENFRCRLARDTVVSASVKAKGRGGPVPELAFRLGAHDVAGSEILPRGRGAALV